MYETMQEANGVGLAAPQISVLRRVVVIDVGDEHGKIELINPVITSMKGKQHELEGCLSVPGMWGYVDRPAKEKVKAHSAEFQSGYRGYRAFSDSSVSRNRPSERYSVYR